jgi:hypothetical protein
MRSRAIFCSMGLFVALGTFTLCGCEENAPRPEGVPEKAPEAASTEYQQYQSKPVKGKPKGGHSSPGGGAISPK